MNISRTLGNALKEEFSGKEVYLQYLPKEKRSGLVLRASEVAGLTGELRRASVQILCYEQDYYTTEDTARSVADFIEGRKGYSENCWAVSSRVEIVGAGLDELNRECNAVSFEVVF